MEEIIKPLEENAKNLDNNFDTDQFFSDLEGAKNTIGEGLGDGGGGGKNKPSKGWTELVLLFVSFLCIAVYFPNKFSSYFR